MTAANILSPALIENNIERIPFSDCWYWVGSAHECGYGKVVSRGVRWRAHRAAWFIFRGEIGGKHVLHRCDTPACVNPAHLFLGTHQENMEDREKKNRNKLPPPESRFRKLTEFAVRSIYADPRPGNTLAEENGVSPQTICDIKKKRIWKHLWA